MSVRPIFLLSLPRTGSTLVQRVLGAHERVATASEPWLMLPFLYAQRERGAQADYGHFAAAQAIQDFARSLPGGLADYDRELADFARRLYALSAGEGATYFVDKNPRYHLVVDELTRLFPDAKLVFLWRNPLATLGSLLETFVGGRFAPYEFTLDLYGGVDRLTRAWQDHGADAIAVGFERLVHGEEEWRRLFGYLELDFDPAVLSRFSDLRLPGRFGDPTGVERYAEISEEPLDKWRSSLAGGVRTAWTRRWLRWIGADRMATMGYDLEALLADLQTTPPSNRSSAVDALQLLASRLRHERRRRALALDPARRRAMSSPPPAPPQRCS